MGRLTRCVKENENGKFYACMKNMSDFDGTEFIEANQKLGQLEDIEEELGIDLITLWKAIHNGVYAKNYEQGIHYISLINWNCGVSRINGKLKPSFSFNVWVSNEEDIDDTIYNIEDYGKTWALTKEELEK